MTNLTPDDVAEFREFYRMDDRAEGRCIRALADALEAAWAERDQHLVTIEGLERTTERLVAQAHALQNQIDSAEAALEAERDEHAEHCLQSALLEDRIRTWVEERNAALARVQALCDDLDQAPEDHNCAYADEIRAAIEGDN